MDIIDQNTKPLERGDFDNIREALRLAVEKFDTKGEMPKMSSEVLDVALQNLAILDKKW